MLIAPTRKREKMATLAEEKKHRVNKSNILILVKAIGKPKETG